LKILIFVICAYLWRQIRGRLT